MRVESAAGSFGITITEVASENGELVMKGKMGIWDANIYLSSEELEQMLRGATIHGTTLDFVALFTFRYLSRLVREPAAGAPSEGAHQ